MKGKIALLCIYSYVLLFIVGGCGATYKQVKISDRVIQSEKEKQLNIVLSKFMERKERLHRVSYPLLLAAGKVFPDQVRPFYGFFLHDRELYKKLLGKVYKNANHQDVHDYITASYVLPNHPAVSAGLRAGDQVLSINDKSLKDMNARKAMKILNKKDLSKNSPLKLCIKRNGKTKELYIKGVSIKNCSIKLVKHDAVNAFTDIKKVSITTGMMRFAQMDKELAFVVGHEIAHHALKHVAKKIGYSSPGIVIDQIASGVGIPTFGFFGKLTGHAYSKTFESEADYVALYILALAKYEYSDAAYFFRRMAIEHPGSVKKSFFATHPSSPERFLAIESSVKEIDEKKRIGKPLMPEKSRKTN